MKRKTLTAICCFAFISPLFSQTTLPTTQDNKSKYLGTPLITIKGEEISRFPTNNFLDAVNGLYPWLFSVNGDHGKYLYVVNGSILLDVNAISLHDIEEVSFTRSHMDGTLYPFSQVGIFYIKTKHTDSRKPVISFNSQYNTMWDKQTSYNSQYSKEDNILGHLQTNHISVSVAADKLQFYGSALVNTIKDPHLSYFSDNGSGSIVDTWFGSKHLNIGTFAQLTYQFSPTISAGISANYYHAQTKRESQLISQSFGSQYDQSQQSKNRLSYYHISPYFNWAITSRLRNTLNFEYANDWFTFNSTTITNFSSTGNPPTNQLQEQETTPYLRGYILRNHLEYDLISTAKFKTSLSAIFSYLNREVRNKQEYSFIQNGMPVSVGNNFFYAREKITTLNPMVHFSYDDIFSAYAGHSFLLNKREVPFIPLTSKSKTSYYTGTILNIKNLLKKTGNLERLELSFHYGNMAKNASNNYWLPVVDDAFNFPDLQFEGTLDGNDPGSVKFDLFRSQLMTAQFNSAFLNGRVQAGVEWSRLKQNAQYIVPAPLGGFTYVRGNMIQKGIAIYSSVKLIDRDKQQWKMRLNVLFPDRDHKTGSDYFDLSEVNYTMQAGLQNYFNFGGWYAQVNGLLGLERKTYNYNNLDPESGESATDIILNYILIGYNFSVSPKSVFSKLGLFIHARNLAGTKKTADSYAYNGYAGAGIHFQMK
jgi:hypothetical protein